MEEGNEEIAVEDPQEEAVSDVEKAEEPEPTNEGTEVGVEEVAAVEESPTNNAAPSSK